MPESLALFQCIYRPSPLADASGAFALKAFATTGVLAQVSAFHNYCCFSGALALAFEATTPAQRAYFFKDAQFSIKFAEFDFVHAHTGSYRRVATVCKAYMARVRDILNRWGVQGGPNPQRTDLWQIDLSAVIAGINDVPDIQIALPDIPRYYHASVSLPELKIKADVVRRDSRSYNMPSWDEPLDAIKMVFVVDDGGNNTANASDASHSTIYMILDTWRELVRAGRGAVGAEQRILLDANYRIDYAFPVYVYLLRGQKLVNLSVSVPAPQPIFAPVFDSTQGATFDGGNPNVMQSTQSNTIVPFGQSYSHQSGQLDVSGILRLENAWLAGFKVADMSYERSGVLTIEATLYADNILQIRRESQ